MRIFLNIPIHTYSRQYRSNSPEYIHDVSIGTVIFSNNIIENDIMKRIKELTVDTSTLSKPMKVYFDPCCKYPRYKLKDNPDYKRVIKQSNADIVIYTSISDKLTWRGLNYNCRHFLINGELYSINSELLKLKTLRNFLEITDDVIVEELEYTVDKLVSNDIGQSLHNLFYVYTKIISDKQLDKMINSSLMNMTDEDYTSIKGMLQSKDDETFKLGLKMLIGYNTNSNAVRIGTLLVEYCGDRSYMLTDVNTTQILSTLGLSKRSIQHSDSYKTYINELITKSTSEDDKQFARKFIINNTYERLRDYQASVLRAFEDMNIKVDIEIY